MSSPDPFEERLRHQPFRPLPTAWREHILLNARAQAAPAAAGATRRAAWWRELLWPCPQAWAALAAVWILLVALQRIGQPPQPQFAAQAQPPSPATRALLREQIELRTELMGAAPAPDLGTPRTPGASPRSHAYRPPHNA
jgi:hypothetical protein